MIHKLGKHNGKSGLGILARLLIWDATVAQEADITTVEYAVYDADGNQLVALTDVGSLSGVVLDALATGTKWTADTTGYNFELVIPAASFTAVGRTRIELKITPAVGAVFWELFEVDVIDVNAD